MNPVKDFAIQRPELANPAAFHQRLTRWNSRRLQPAIPSDDWQAAAREDAEMIGVEGAWIERMRRDAEPWLADLPDEDLAAAHRVFTAVLAAMTAFQADLSS